MSFLHDIEDAAMAEAAKIRALARQEALNLRKSHLAAELKAIEEELVALVGKLTPAKADPKKK